MLLSAPFWLAALRSGDDPRWLIEAGHNRFPVAATIDIRRMTVLVTQVVRREDSMFWPRGADGTFTEEGALKVLTVFLVNTQEPYPT